MSAALYNRTVIITLQNLQELESGVKTKARNNAEHVHQENDTLGTLMTKWVRIITQCTLLASTRP